MRRPLLIGPDRYSHCASRGTSPPRGWSLSWTLTTFEAALGPLALWPGSDGHSLFCFCCVLTAHTKPASGQGTRARMSAYASCMPLTPCLHISLSPCPLAARIALKNERLHTMDCLLVQPLPLAPRMSPLIYSLR